MGSWQLSNRLLSLQLVIAGAFYPHYFYWGLADNQLAQKEMSGHDPSTTVMVKQCVPVQTLTKLLFFPSVVWTAPSS